MNHARYFRGFLLFSMLVAILLATPATSAAAVMYLMQDEVVAGKRSFAFAVDATDTVQMGVEVALTDGAGGYGGYIEVDGYRIYTGSNMRRLFSSQVNFALKPGAHTFTIGFNAQVKVQYIKMFGIGRTKFLGLRLLKAKTLDNIKNSIDSLTPDEKRELLNLDDSILPARSITLPIPTKTTTRVPEKVQKDERKYKLFANTQPDNTIVRILNIKRTFKQGVELKPGKYHIEVAKNGYETKRQWIEIKESDLSINIELNELKKEDIFLIDVLVEGIDDGVKTSKRQDRDEALIDAKRQAIERAGVDVSAITIVEDFKLKKDWIESKAKAILIPGFQIIDKGYQNDGTYLVILSGKVKSIL